MDEYLANCTKPADGEVCRTHDNPFSKVGALRVLHGNVAPDGGIVKKSAPSTRTCSRIPALPACFNSEDASMRGHLRR